jgi:transglutaminase-like putative cysteine protease
VEYYPLQVRFGGELHDPREFVTPNAYMVRAACADITEGIASEADRVYALWDWVCRNIRYPLTADGTPTDIHILRAFPLYEGWLGSRYRVNLTAVEFFATPAETLAQGVGDCDDSSLLLGSLLLNILPEERVNVIIGSVRGRPDEADHAWVEVYMDGRWNVLETTLASAPEGAFGVAGRIAGARDSYLPFVRFNDRDLVEEIPLVLEPRGAGEVGKLRYIAGLWGCRTKC